jgi:hypothetical protein
MPACVDLLTQHTHRTPVHTPLHLLTQHTHRTPVHTPLHLQAVGTLLTQHTHRTPVHTPLHLQAVGTLTCTRWTRAAQLPRTTSTRCSHTGRNGGYSTLARASVEGLGPSTGETPSATGHPYARPRREMARGGPSRWVVRTQRCVGMAR